MTKQAACHFSQLTHKPSQVDMSTRTTGHCALLENPRNVPTGEQIHRTNTYPLSDNPYAQHSTKHPPLRRLLQNTRRVFC